MIFIKLCTNYTSITLYILNFLNTYFTSLNYNLYCTLHPNIKVTVNLDKGRSQRGRGGCPPFLAHVVYSSYSLIEKKRKRSKRTSIWKWPRRKKEKEKNGHPHKFSPLQILLLMSYKLASHQSQKIISNIYSLYYLNNTNHIFTTSVCKICSSYNYELVIFVYLF